MFILLFRADKTCESTTLFPTTISATTTKTTSTVGFEDQFTSSEGSADAIDATTETTIPEMTTPETTTSEISTPETTTFDTINPEITTPSLSECKKYKKNLENLLPGTNYTIEVIARLKNMNSTPENVSGVITCKFFFYYAFVKFGIILNKTRVLNKSSIIDFKTKICFPCFLLSLVNFLLLKATACN